MEGGSIMIRLTVANIKRYLKNHTLLINMVMLPIILIFSLNFFIQQLGKSINVLFSSSNCI